MRLLNISPAESLLEEIFIQVMSSNVITINERKQIRSVLSGGDLGDDESAIINRLVYRIRRGWVKLAE